MLIQSSRGTIDHRHRHIRPAAMLRDQALATDANGLQLVLFLFYLLPLALFACYVAPTSRNVPTFSASFSTAGRIRCFCSSSARRCSTTRRGCSSQSLKACWSVASIVDPDRRALPPRQADPDDLGDHQPVAARLLQVFQLRRRELRHPCRLDRPPQLRLDTALRVTLPLGISFYTFESMSYVIDVRGQARAIRNIVDFAAFVSMFPQLVAGPIIRFSDIADQIRSRTHTVTKFTRGGVLQPRHDQEGPARQPLRKDC